MMKRSECMRALAERRTDEVVIPVMTAGREWLALSAHSLDMPLVTAMGQAPDVGLGIALAQPHRRVVVLNGDGSMLMNLPSLVTVSNAAPPNYTLFVVQNGTYELTGGQPLPGLDKFSFAGLARMAGFPKVYEYEELADFEADIQKLLTEEGPVFATLKVEANPLPNVAVPKIADVVERLRPALRGEAPEARPV